MLKFENKKNPSSTNSNYHNITNTYPQVMVHCSENAPIPSCKGNFYFSGNKFLTLIIFPTEELPNWKKIAEATIGLLDKWHIKDPEEIKRLNQISINRK